MTGFHCTINLSLWLFSSLSVLSVHCLPLFLSFFPPPYSSSLLPLLLLTPSHYFCLVLFFLTLLQDYHLAKRYYDLAAETSAEAVVPASLALLKLNLMYEVDHYKEVCLL